MSKRQGFVIYHEDMRVCDLLTNEQLGQLVRMLWAHSEGRDVDPGALIMPFSFMAQKIDRDEDKYQRRVEKNRDAANQRWNAEKGTDDADASK